MDESVVSTETTETTEVSNADYWPDDISDILAEVESDTGESEAETGSKTEAENAEEETGSGEEAAPENTGDGEAKPEPDEVKAEEPPPEPETFTLKHLDEVRTVNRDEVIALAQKGMDYDRIRSKYEDANSELADLKDWLKKYTGGQDINEFRDDTDAKIISKREGIDYATARERIRLDKERKALEAEKLKAENERSEAESLRKKAADDLKEFSERYPEVSAKLSTDKAAVPKEVWEAVKHGERLVDAYDKYQSKLNTEALKKRISELEGQVKAQEQEKLNKKNAARSAGSQKSSGDDHVDLIDLGWNSV